MLTIGDTANTLKMWKIEINLSIVFALILIEAAQQSSSMKVANKNYKHDCYAMCNSAGTKAEFDEESWNCKCILTANVDDTELALIQKNVKLLNLPLETSNPSPNINKTKRHISTGITKNQFSQPSFYKKVDPIVGQAFGQSNQHAIAQNAALQRQLEQLRQRLRELTNRAATRNQQNQSFTLEDRIRSAIRGYNTETATHLRGRQSQSTQERRANERQRHHFLNDQRIAAGSVPRPHPARRIGGGVVGYAVSQDLTTLPPSRNKGAHSAEHDDIIPAKSPYGSVITQPQDLSEDN